MFIYLPVVFYLHLSSLCFLLLLMRIIQRRALKCDVSYCTSTYTPNFFFNVSCITTKWFI